MNKKEKVEIIARILGKNKKGAEEFLHDLNSVVETLGREIEIPENEKEIKIKLGDYVVLNKRIVPARERKNPSNGETIMQPEHIEVIVKRSSKLKGLLK